MKVANLKPGQVLYDVTKETMMKTVAVRLVRVTAVDGDRFRAVWNGNVERTYAYGVPRTWRKTKPTVVEAITGKMRLARRGERGKLTEGPCCFKLTPEGR